MLCGTQLNTYACSNATGTTCTKVAVSIVKLNTSVVCGPAELVVMNGDEYGALVNNDVSLFDAFSQVGIQVSDVQTSYQTVLSSLAGGGGGTVDPNPDIIQAEGVIFAATLVAIASIYGLKRVYRLLVPEGAGHD